MSEFLRDVLSQAKGKVDALEGPEAEAKEARAVVPEPVDNLPVDKSPTGITSIPGIAPIPDEGTGITTIPGIAPIPDEQAPKKSATGIAEIPDGELKIVRNYMRFDMDLFPVLFSLNSHELRIYLYFVMRTYGQIPPRNICRATRRMIGDMTEIPSPNAQVRTLRSLEAMHLIKRLITSTGKGEMSLYRVYLPSERPGVQSQTVIRYSGDTT